FLQDWKAVLLPLIDVAVSLIGTFAIMKLMGFSLNNLTLFGLVLAIGIVVDDAIVVLENIERWIGMGHPVREATIKAMDELTATAGMRRRPCRAGALPPCSAGCPCWYWNPWSAAGWGSVPRTSRGGRCGAFERCSCCRGSWRGGCSLDRSTRSSRSSSVASTG